MLKSPAKHRLWATSHCKNKSLSPSSLLCQARHWVTQHRNTCAAVRNCGHIISGRGLHCNCLDWGKIQRELLRVFAWTLSQEHSPQLQRYHYFFLWWESSSLEKANWAARSVCHWFNKERNVPWSKVCQKASSPEIKNEKLYQQGILQFSSVSQWDNRQI